MEPDQERSLIHRPSHELTTPPIGANRILGEMVENSLTLAKNSAREAEELNAFVREGKQIQGSPGMTPENIRAFNLFFRAATAGHAEAELELGTCFTFGIGVECNCEEGFRWLRSAAHKRNINAQFMLGLCYSLGKGVPQDYRHSYIWFRLASDRGLEAATKALATLTSSLAPSELEMAEYLYSSLKKNSSTKR